MHTWSDAIARPDESQTRPIGAFSPPPTQGSPETADMETNPLKEPRGGRRPLSDLRGASH
jgi:hypothetical protein